MTHFDHVTEVWGSLKYMRESRARFLRDLINKNDSRDVLELGFFHGKSSAYIAAILEDRGSGHLTTIDVRNAAKHDPSINTVLEKVGLSHRVDPIFAHRSYTWELAKMLQKTPRPKFDLCFLDGGHTWDATGFGFALVDMLLRPGGWIIFDDLDWTIDHGIEQRPSSAVGYARFSEDEKKTPGVRMVWDLLVPHLGYFNRFEERAFRWGIAQKPLQAPALG